MADRPIPAWLPIASSTGWTLSNIDNYGGGWHLGQFRFDPVTGEVRLRGLLKVTTSAAWSITAPAYLRPLSTGSYAGTEIFTSGTDAGGTQQYLRLDLSTGGAISPSGTASNSAGAFITLTGIVWYTN